MKKINNIFSFISISASIICVIIIVKINYEMAIQYLRSSPKTQALFGLSEIFQYYYKFYYILISLIALVFAIIASSRKESKRAYIIAYCFSIFSVILIFLSIWKIIVIII